MGNGKKSGGGLSAHQITGGQSLASIKAMHARQMEIGRNIENVIDYRKKELEATQQLLYTQIEDFRLNQHTELRREVEVSWDIALRMLPWWKRWNLAGVSTFAKQVAETIKEQTIHAHRRAEQDAADKLAAERNQQIAEEEAKKAEELANRKPLAPEEMAMPIVTEVKGNEAEMIAESKAMRPGKHIGTADEYGRQVEIEEPVVSDVINIGDLQPGEEKTVFIPGVNAEGPGPDDIEEEEETPVDLEALKA